jgi:hypothetical protein
VAHKKFATSKLLSRSFKDNFGRLWVDGIEPNSNEYVSCIQTLNNRLKEINLSPDIMILLLLMKCIIFQHLLIDQS